MESAPGDCKDTASRKRVVIMTSAIHSPLTALWQGADKGSREALLGVLTRLARLPLFASLGYELRTALINQMQWLAMPAGTVLYEQGDAPDALYVLLHGRLALSRRDGRGRECASGWIVPGETVGEFALIADQPRRTRAVAMRDSELLRLPREGYQTLIDAHPRAMQEMASAALRRHAHERSAPLLPQCFALLPAHRGIDVQEFALRFARALQVQPSHAVVTAEDARGRGTDWFSEREAQSPYVLYVGTDDAGWRTQCLHQSDWALVLADGARTPGECAPLLPLPATGLHLQQHLVLLQNGMPRVGSTRVWREAFTHTRDQHHIRNDDDVARMARRLQGRALGLVLSGGGARGFAHLGVVRALREAGLHIDHVGGASIGAIMAAGIAADWPMEQAIDIYRRGFVDSNPLSDWALPLVAMRRGYKVAQLLRGAHGECDIEDLPLPFFCVSSDLSRGRLQVDERGLLWRALRASCAIPGVLPPVFSGGRILVDGGVIDNLPVGEMRKRLAGHVVGVDVSGGYPLAANLEEAWTPPWWQLLPELFGQRQRPGIAQLLLRAGMVNADATSRRHRRQTQVLFSPALESIDLLGWKAFERAVEIGYRDTMARLEREPELIEGLRRSRYLRLSE